MIGNVTLRWIAWTFCQGAGK